MFSQIFYTIHFYFSLYIYPHIHTYNACLHTYTYISIFSRLYGALLYCTVGMVYYSLSTNLILKIEKIRKPSVRRTVMCLCECGGALTVLQPCRQCVTVNHILCLNRPVNSCASFSIIIIQVFWFLRPNKQLNNKNNIFIILAIL